MAKGKNIRGNKEAKKPKQAKKATLAVPSAAFDKGFNPSAGLGAKKKA